MKHIDIERRINALVAEMTLEEKLGQMTYTSPTGKNPMERVKEDIRSRYLGVIANATTAELCNELQRIAVEETRHGIPLIFGRDVIHGYRTIFPIPHGLASSWDPSLLERTAHAAAAEAAADGMNLTFTPMMDVALDPRWGRIMESYSEDPYLTCVMAVAMVRGYQGDDMSQPDRLAACAKHMVGQGAAVGGRDYGETDITERTLREVYLPPFKASVEAGVATIMCEFNDIGGIPNTGNRWLLTDVVRGEWGFAGVMFSDWDSVVEMIPWGFAADQKEAALKALNAGVDVEMFSRSYIAHARELIAEGKISMKVVDDAVRRILRTKFRMGLFDCPYVEPNRASKVIFCKEHLALAREAAARSTVLLKNEGHLLPLSEDVRKIALIGPLADAPADQMGNWTTDGKLEDSITIVEGLRGEAPTGTEIVHVPALADCLDENSGGFDEAVRAAEEADVAILVVGEPRQYCGESRSRAYLDLPGIQQQLVEAIHATGTPVVVVIMCGRPLAIPWIAENIPAILVIWHPGTMAGPALADVLWGRINPSGRLTASWPRTVGQIPVCYNHKNTGRPPKDDTASPIGTSLDPGGFMSGYVDCPRNPQFPFGYGLSYTRFHYDNLTVSPETMREPIEVTVAVDVENMSQRLGVEVVQLYLRDVAASATRPVKELKAFQRVPLAPGEKKTVEFKLTAEDLALWDAQMRYVVEPGEFHVFVGPNCIQVLKSAFYFEHDEPVPVNG